MEKAYNKDTSRRLYDYLCKRIGTEEDVRVRRTFYAAVDYYNDMKEGTYISSGSKAEGLDMSGSDMDIMIVLNALRISQKPTENSFLIPNNFVMDTEDTKSGFTQLILHSWKISPNIHKWCVWQGGKLRLSIENIKTHFLQRTSKDLFDNSNPSKIIHGPCISDVEDSFDIAYCVRCDEWTEKAQPWVERSRKWPSVELVSRITSYGVLCLPIGCKGSQNEIFEWRISFSVAEKHLIYTFSHTQLLCYAMLKLLLKEVIEKHTHLKGLLCSYFLKTVMFWVSEELQVTIWRPENIILCFLHCFRRLIYSVAYEILPHYFIIENNLFEKWFDVEEHLELLSFLSDQYNRGINCLIQSTTMSDFYFNFNPPSINRSDLDVICRQINTINKDKWIKCDHAPIEESVKATLLFRRVKLKLNSFVPTVTFYRFCQLIGRNSLVDLERNNKTTYQISRQNMPYLILGTQADAVSGWLCVATYYYCLKQLKTSLDIILYVLTKSSPDRLLIGEILSPELLDTIEREGLRCGHLTISDFYKHKMLDDLYFHYKHTMIPLQLELELSMAGVVRIPPVVYAHFLSFLCWFYLRDNEKCRQALNNVRLTIHELFFIRDFITEARSYMCLGIGLSMVGQFDSAKKSFEKSINLKRRHTSNLKQN